MFGNPWTTLDKDALEDLVPNSHTHGGTIAKPALPTTFRETTGATRFVYGDGKCWPLPKLTRSGSESFN